MNEPPPSSVNHVHKGMSAQTKTQQVNLYHQLSNVFDLFLSVRLSSSAEVTM